VPVGAVVADASGTVIGTGRNIRERDHDPTGHAEIVAMREAAAALGEWRLEGCTLVVTLEPCVMCAGAAQLARVDGVVYGAVDMKAGALGSLYNVGTDARLNHEYTVVSGVRAAESIDLLSRFFADLRS
jgi:tRNA(adenine34) deaminase